MKLFFFVIIRYLDVNFTHPDPPIKSFTKKKGGGKRLGMTKDWIFFVVVEIPKNLDLILTEMNAQYKKKKKNHQSGMDGSESFPRLNPMPTVSRKTEFYNRKERLEVGKVITFIISFLILCPLQTLPSQNKC